MLRPRFCLCSLFVNFTSVGIYCNSVRELFIAFYFLIVDDRKGPGKVIVRCAVPPPLSWIYIFREVTQGINHMFSPDRLYVHVDNLQ